MKNCLVTGGSKNASPLIGTFLYNVRDTQTWVDEIIIYHDGISCKDQALMQKIMPVKFIRYKFPGCRKNFNEVVKYKYREAVFSKFECLKLLEEYDNVVWSDYDVVMLKDISAMIFDNTSGFKSLMYHPPRNTCFFKDQVRAEAWNILADRYDLTANSIATGLFAFSKSFDFYRKFYDKCISLCEKWGGIVTLPDQAIFNMAMQDMRVTPEIIPWTYACHPEEDKELLPDAFILHAYGGKKFWNGLDNPIWNKNYNLWLKIGGKQWRVSWEDKLRNLICSLVYRKNSVLKKINQLLRISCL